MTIVRLILQARDLEEGNEVSLTDFYERIPFMEVEDMVRVLNNRFTLQLFQDIHVAIL